MKRFSLITLFATAFMIGCERHDFEETRKLHDKPGLAAPVEDEGKAGSDGHE